MANEVLYEALELECLGTVRKVIGGRAPLLTVREAPAFVEAWSSRELLFVDVGNERGLIVAAAVMGRSVAQRVLEKLPEGIRCELRVAFRRGRLGKAFSLRVGWSLRPA